MIRCIEFSIRKKNPEELRAAEALINQLYATYSSDMAHHIKHIDRPVAPRQKNVDTRAAESSGVPAAASPCTLDAAIPNPSVEVPIDTVTAPQMREEVSGSVTYSREELRELFDDDNKNLIADSRETENACQRFLSTMPRENAAAAQVKPSNPPASRYGCDQAPQALRNIDCATLADDDGLEMLPF